MPVRDALYRELLCCEVEVPLQQLPGELMEGIIFQIEAVHRVVQLKQDALHGICRHIAEVAYPLSEMLEE